MRSKAHLWPSFCMPGKGPYLLRGVVGGVAMLPSRPAATREYPSRRFKGMKGCIAKTGTSHCETWPRGRGDWEGARQRFLQDQPQHMRLLIKAVTQQLAAAPESP